nr:reverse transcriptase domain-containing protein [Tanacetum cinerariifolium]
MNPNNVQGPPPAGPPPQNHNGPLGLNLQNLALDLRTMKELCQSTMNGRRGPIAPVNIQAIKFGLKNHMIQQVQYSCQFHGLPGDDANKHLDKFLTITQSMKQNGEMAFKFLSKYFPPFMVTKLKNDIDTFYNGLTLRHRDIINAAAGGTFMKRRPEECYDLIKNMTAHHNDWDTLAHRGESSSFTISFSSEIATLTRQMTKMRKDILQIYRSNQQVSSMTPSCETCGGPHSYYECQAAGGYTQDVLHKRPQGGLPSNTIPNPQEDIKVITARSGMTLAGPSVPSHSSSSSKKVEQDLETITDQVFPESTTRVPPLVVRPSLVSRSFELPPSTSTFSMIPERNPHQPLIPYPSRLNKEKLQDKSDIQIYSLMQMFKKLYFNISFAEALAHMPKW